MHRGGLRDSERNRQGDNDAASRSYRCDRNRERALPRTVVRGQQGAHQDCLAELTVGWGWSLSEGVPGMGEAPGRGPGPMGMCRGSS